jgi:hypothetical protein
MRTNAVILVILAGLATVTTAAAAGRTVVGSGAMEAEAWNGPTGGAPVRVVNPYGDLRLRHSAAGDTLDVAAMLQQLSVDGSRLALDVTASDEEMVVAIVRLDFEGNPAPEVPRGDSARADISVSVPAVGPVRAETAGGLLEARGVRADLDLRSDRGAISIAGCTGRIVANAKMGSIEAALGGGGPGPAHMLSSDSGSITVTTDPSNGLDVTMATSGDFRTDFSLTVEHHDGEQPDKIATATVGAGGRKLVMSSASGELGLLRIAPK